MTCLLSLVHTDIEFVVQHGFSPGAIHHVWKPSVDSVKLDRVFIHNRGLVFEVHSLQLTTALIYCRDQLNVERFHVLCHNTHFFVGCPVMLREGWTLLSTAGLPQVCRDLVRNVLPTFASVILVAEYHKSVAVNNTHQLLRAVARVVVDVGKRVN